MRNVLSVAFLISLLTAALPMAAGAAGASHPALVAQTQALPTAPGADRATQGGAAMAPASLPKVAGASPLEPYLITWLLPAFGIIGFLACVVVDKRLRAG